MQADFASPMTYTSQHASSKSGPWHPQTSSSTSDENPQPRVDVHQQKIYLHDFPHHLQGADVYEPRMWPPTHFAHGSPPIHHGGSPASLSSLALNTPASGSSSSTTSGALHAPLAGPSTWNHPSSDQSQHGQSAFTPWPMYQATSDPSLSRGIPPPASPAAQMPHGISGLSPIVYHSQPSPLQSQHQDPSSSSSIPKWHDRSYVPQSPMLPDGQHFPFHSQFQQHLPHDPLRSAGLSSLPRPSADAGGTTAAPPPPGAAGTSPSHPRQNRHLACAFCRGRKLKCIVDEDGLACRQCQRRSLECSLPNPSPEAQEVPKAKKRRATAAGSIEPLTANRNAHDESGEHFANDGGSPAKKRKKRASGPATLVTTGAPADNKPAAIATQPAASHATRDWDLAPASSGNGDAQQFTQPQNSIFTIDSIPQLAPTHDMDYQLPLITKDADAGFDATTTATADLTLRAPAPQPLRWSSDWWERCLGMFGQRPQAIRIVENLLTRFLASHNTMMAILHGPTLMYSLRSRKMRDDLHPAVVYAVLSTSVCDLQSNRLEPYLADMSTADMAAQTLARKLRQTSLEYIEASLMDPYGLDVALGQAVSVLILTSSSSEERDRLLSLVEAVITKAQLGNSAAMQELPEGLPRPEDPAYYSPVRVLHSSDAEIKREAVTRLCKTHASHAVRVVLAKPDEDFDQFRLPPYLANALPHDHWVLSDLSSPLPPSYWASRHFSRAAWLMSKIFYNVNLLPIDLTPNLAFQNEQRSDVKSILRDLSKIEDTFRWLRRGGQYQAVDIFPKEGQVLLVKLHVSTRFSLWRRTGVWKSADDSDTDNQGLLPSFDWWFEAFSACINSLENDWRRSKQNGVPLQSSNAEVESSLRHVRLGVQMQMAMSYTHSGISKFLRKALDALQVQVDMRPLGLCSDLQPLSQFMNQVRGEVDAEAAGQHKIVSWDDGVVNFDGAGMGSAAAVTATSFADDLLGQF